jgi:hypothetical protein
MTPLVNAEEFSNIKLEHCVCWLELKQSSINNYHNDIDNLIIKSPIVIFIICFSLQPHDLESFVFVSFFPTAVNMKKALKKRVLRGRKVEKPE